MRERRLALLLALCVGCDPGTSVPIDAGPVDAPEALDADFSHDAPAGEDAGPIDGGCTARSWYPDTDGDGYGAATGAVTSCTAPAGHVGSRTDCDDACAECHPGAPEICDGARDESCAGAVDVGCPPLPIPTWAERIGEAPQGDFAYSVAIAPDGAVVVAGRFNAVLAIGAESITSAGAEDGYVARFDATGSIDWLRRIGGASSDQALSVCVDDAGATFVAGHFAGTDDLGDGVVLSTGSSTRASYVASYDAAGRTRWAIPLTATTWLDVLAVARDPSGGVFGAAVFQGTATLGAHSIDSTLLRSHLLFHVTDAGEVDAAVLADLEGDAQAFELAAGAEGPCVAGRFAGALTVGASTVTAAEAFDAFVACFDRTLAPRFVGRVGGTGSDDATGVTVSSTHVLVAGNFQGSTTAPMPMTSVGVTDGFVAAWALDGTLAWARAVGCEGTERALGIAEDGAGGAYLVGRFNGATGSVGGVALTGAGRNDAFAARYRADGTVAWAVSSGGALNDEAVAAAAGPGGALAIVGSFYGPATFGGESLSTSGSTDVDAFVQLMRGR